MFVSGSGRTILNILKYPDYITSKSRDSVQTLYTLNLNNDSVFIFRRTVVFLTFQRENVAFRDYIQKKMEHVIIR